MSAESAAEILFKSMVVGCPHDLVEVYRTLRLSGPRDAVLRTLGQSAVLCGIQDLGPLRLEGRMAPIRLLSPNQETEMELDPELDPERVAKALIATIHLDHRAGQGGRAGGAEPQAVPGGGGGAVQGRARGGGLRLGSPVCRSTARGPHRAPGQHHRRIHGRAVPGDGGPPQGCGVRRGARGVRLRGSR